MATGHEGDDRAGIRHARVAFYASLLIGICVWIATYGHHPMLRILLASDTFFALFIALVLRIAFRSSTEHLRSHVVVPRRGAALVLSLAAVAVVLSLVAIFTLLNHPRGEGWLFPIVAVASVPLSFAMMHTIAAFNYARLYYAPDPRGRESAGLVFPGSNDPGAPDFLYYAFSVGMSFSASDVVAKTRRMRLATLWHALISFVFNTCLIALAVNAAMTFTS